MPVLGQNLPHTHSPTHDDMPASGCTTTSRTKEEALIFCSLCSSSQSHLSILNMRISDFFYGNRKKNPTALCQRRLNDDRVGECLPFAAPALCLLWLPEHAADPAQLSAPKEVTVALGGSLSVSCRYDHKYRDHTKYWCKGKIYELCKIVVKTPRNRQSDTNFIADHKQERFFTVTMTSLRQRDEGKYWCVVATSGRNVHTGVTVRISHAGRTHLVRFSLWQR